MSEHNFIISQKKLEEFGADILKLGQQHKFEPAELMVATKLVQNWLEDQLGLVKAEVTTHEEH